MKYFGNRLFEGLLFPMMVSLLGALILKSGIITQYVPVVFFSFLITILYNQYMLSRHLFAVKRRSVFYKTNFAVQGIVFVLSVIFALLNIKEFCLFTVMQYLIFIPLGLKRVVSVIIVNLIFALCIFITPKIARQKRDRRAMF